MVKLQICGSGGHYPYVLGLIKGLQNKGLKSKHLDTIHAYSSGAIIAVLFCLDVDIDSAMHHMHDNIMRDISKYKTGSVFRFLPVLKKHMLDYINRIGKKAYTKLNNKVCISNLTIGIGDSFLRQTEVTIFTSNEDLVNTCIASGFIPIYHHNIMLKHRGNYMIDAAIYRQNPDNIQINISRNMFRNLYPLFGSHLFITSDRQKVMDMYKLGISDSENIDIVISNTEF